MLRDQQVRWGWPSRPYWIALLIFVVLAILFMLNDWRVMEQNRETTPTTKVIASP